MTSDTVALLVVPTCFLLAGVLGLRLGTPRSIAAGLAGVGGGHLLALAASAIALDTTGTTAAVAHLTSLVFFAGGFVALLWIAVVFPDGGGPGRAVWLAMAGSAVCALLAALSGPTPTVLASDDELGPVAHILPDHVAVVGGVPLLLLPVATLGVFAARFVRADGDRRQMMLWPVAGVAVVAVLAACGILLGRAYPGAADAAFFVAAPVVPLTVAFGPVRRRLLSLTDQTGRLSADLAARVAELEESRRRLAAATDAERRRIERDLHDGAQQELLALIAQAEVARASDDAGQRARALERVAELAHGAYETVRRVSHGVRPAVLDDLGLAAAVRAAAERLPVPVHLDLAEPRHPPDPEVASATLFVATEALANVLKHAGAHRVRVRLLELESGLRLEVEDDGRGGINTGGFGVRGLRDRVESVGGTVSIESRPGRSVLTATFPGTGRD